MSILEKAMTVYHGSPASNRDSILKRGLIGKRGGYSNHSVYVSTKFSEALSLSQSTKADSILRDLHLQMKETGRPMTKERIRQTVYDYVEPNSVIFTIHLPAGTPADDDEDSDDGWEVFGDIPPNLITGSKVLPYEVEDDFVDYLERQLGPRKHWGTILADQIQAEKAAKQS